jgi:hypothetical protein
MRSDILQKELGGWTYKVIDTDIPFFHSRSLYRAIGFRFKRGPLIRQMNQYVLEHLPEESIDLCWVDKAIYLTAETTSFLRQRCGKLVHYTPDTAFRANRSRLFFASARYYDLMVTTKTFEKADYARLIPEHRVVCVTQGYDPGIHRPYHRFSEKGDWVSFVGLYEPSRGKLIEKLLEGGVRVVLAGSDWQGFVKRYASNQLLVFAGEDLRGEAYSRVLSESLFSLGLLSKRFPELHTTRTFEIPACRTALVTESNAEIRKFYGEQDAIFFSSPADLLDKIQYYQSDKVALKNLTLSGYERVTSGAYSYEAILKGVLKLVLN